MISGDLSPDVTETQESSSCVVLYQTFVFWLRNMLGVANMLNEQSSADPLANLERLIKENSEVQAGSFQLQHEMRCVLLERNDMRRELFGLVNKEKELVGTLADLCKKAEQQKDFAESISQALKQIQTERAAQKNKFCDAEANFTKYINLVGNLQADIRKARVEIQAIQNQRKATNADICFEQSNLANTMLSLNDNQTLLSQMKEKLFETLTVAQNHTNDILLLQQKISDAFFEIFELQLRARKQIEDFELESNAINSLNVKLDSKRDQITILKSQIRKYRFLIQENEKMRENFESMIGSTAVLMKALESWNSQLVKDLESEQASKKQLIKLLEEISQLERKWNVLQSDCFTSRKSKNSSVMKSMMLQEQILATFEDLGATEYNLQEKQSILLLLSEQKQDLLQKKSQALAQFKNTVQIPLSNQVTQIQKLKALNEQFRDMILKCQDTDQLRNLRLELNELATAFSISDENKLSAMDLTVQGDIITTMFSDWKHWECTVSELDFELQDAFEKLDKLCEKYHENKDRLRITYKKNKELEDRLCDYKNEVEESKAKNKFKFEEKTALYQQRLKEEQVSDVCDLGLVPKEILDDMNNKKQQQARKYNERLCELQAKIDAVSLGDNANLGESSMPSNLKRAVGCTRKLLSKKNMYRFPE